MRSAPFAVVALASLACSRPPAQVAPPAIQPTRSNDLDRLIPTDLPSRYPPPPSEPVVLRCSAGASPSPSPRASLSLGPVPLRPVRAGPLIRDRPRARPARRPGDVTGILAPEPLKACYRWARQAAPALESLMAVQFDVDAWGSVSAVRVEPDRAAAEPLAACVAEVAATERAWGLPTARITRVRQIVQFRRSGLGLPRRRLARPRTAAVAPAGGCMWLPRDLPVDNVSSSRVIEIDDYDDEQAQDEARRAAIAKWIASGRKGRPRLRWASAPKVRIGRATLDQKPRRSLLRRTVASNLGALQTCYADAWQQAPGQVGEAELAISVRPDGLVDRATASGVEPALAGCFAAAARDLEFGPTSGAFDLTVRLRLEGGPHALAPLPRRATIRDVARWAEEALESGFATEALRGYSALIESGATPRCEWLVGALAAARAAAPWLDARVDLAADDLLGQLRRTPTSSPCAARAVAAVADLAGALHLSALDSGDLEHLERAAVWYRRLLALPAPPNADTLRWYLQEVEWRMAY